MRAAAALEARRARELADHGDRPAAGQGQCAAVVLQQHGAFGSELPGEGVMGVHVEPVGGAGRIGGGASRVREASRLGGEAGRAGGEAGQREHAADGGVDDALLQLSGPDGVDDPLRAQAPGAGHLQVQPGGQRGDRVAHGAPVGDDRAGETPFLAQDFGQQPRVLGRIDAVDLVVCAHHRGRLGLGDDPLEGGQVDLAQSPLVDVGADPHPLGLLVVRGEVLDRRPDALVLLALDVRRAEHARQQRILGVVLEVPPAQRRALDVHSGAEHDVHAERPRLPADRRADPPGHPGSQLDPTATAGGKQVAGSAS